MNTSMNWPAKGVGEFTIVPQDPEEREWLTEAARNPAFDFLSDSVEDMYSLADGRPFDEQG